MATLEIHDGLGRVQFVELARDHPVLFGASPTCDVVLAGADIKPVHGRIRWRSNRFKIEASPDAAFVLVNGQRATTKSLHQGDEIVVGPCRMFLLGVGGAGEERRTAAGEVNEGRTVVAAPLAVPTAKVDVPKKDRKEKRRDKEARDFENVPDDVSRSLFESPDAFRLLVDISKTPSYTDVSEEREPETRSRTSRLADKEPASDHELKSASERVPKPKKPSNEGKGLFGGIIQALRDARATAPGREKIVSSPLFIGLVAALLVLVVMGFWLRTVISTMLADRLFNGGISSYEDGDYLTAIRDLDAFQLANPEDTRVGKARVFRAMANVRQYVSPASSTWTSAKTAVEDLLRDVGEEPTFAALRMDLAELVIKIGVGLADRARGNADAKSLADAEHSVQLHKTIAGAAAAAFLTRSPLPAKLTEARAAVRKAETRAKALLAMDQALTNKSAGGVYEARDNLLDEYADLGQDRELIARMTAANELIRKAVTVDRTTRQAEKTTRGDVLGAVTSVVRRSKTAGSGSSEAVPAADTVAFAVSDGLAYGLDARNGRPLWQQPIGLGAPFAPQPVAGDGTMLYFDSRWNELCRAQAATGELVWRIGLGEPAQDPPLVLGNQLYQVLPTGRLLLIALETGELQATVRLGMPLARTAVSDESGRLLYVMGLKDCLFVLARDRLECVGVEYLGHGEGSVACAPARLGRFLVVALNDSLSDGRWKVLVLDQEGARTTIVQEIPINGWTWQTPASSGAFVWATGDRSGFQVFAAGDAANPTPFRSTAKMVADANASGPTFALALSERELWVASGHPGKLILDAERGAIKPGSELTAPGPAAGPIQLAGGVVNMTFNDAESGGLILIGLEPESGAALWKTILGSEWGTPLERSADGKALETLGRDGKLISLDRVRLEKGGFVEVSIPNTGELELPAGLRLRVGLGSRAVSVLTSDAEPGILWVEDKTKLGGWRQMELPARLAAEPVAWGGHLLVPGMDGRVYLVDPLTGASAAEPFVPEYDRARSGRWYAPAVLSDESVILADDAGRVRRVGLKKAPVARLAVEAELMLEHNVAADPATTANAVILVTEDGEVRSLAARNLSPAGAWKLEAPLLGNPVGLDGEAFVMDRAGGVMAFGRDGQRIWSINLGTEVVGMPVVDQASVLFLTRDGKLHSRSRKAGTKLEVLELNVMPVGGMVEAGGVWYVPTGRGSVRAISLGGGKGLP